MPRFVVAMAIVFAVLQAQRALSSESGGRIVPASPLTDSQRAADLSFGPEVTAEDRAWILAAIASARPEARRLIDEIDGRVTIRTHSGSPLRRPRSGEVVLGYADSGPRRTTLMLWVDPVNGNRTVDRAQLVLHELGHVVDYALVPDDLLARLDAGIPHRGVCGAETDGPYGACAPPQERFADTFAKWALRGAISSVGAGYLIPTPPSLDEWGAPLATLG